MKRLLPPLAVQPLEWRSKILHFLPQALLVGLLAPAWLASPLAGQAQAADGPGFRLARSAGSTEDVRSFSQADTLHMWVGGPSQKESLGSPAAGELSGWWFLVGGSQSFSGALTPSGNSLVAALPLGSLSADAEAWSWGASLEWRGGMLAFHSTTVRISFRTPHADFAASTLEGELPLAVDFVDLSQGEITSWAWDFGDGSTSSEPNPSHLYTVAGSHAVSLTVSNAWGSSTHAAESMISVHEPVVVQTDFAIHYGMNASENLWWQRGIAFADAMARAGEFNLVVNGTIGRIPAPLFPLGQQPPLLGEGWPDVSGLAANEKAGTRLFGSMAGSMPDGREQPYVLTWLGTGSCKLDGKGVIREANRTSNRVEVFIDPTAGTGNALLIWLIEWSDPADPVRAAHVWLPGMEAEHPILWPPFVAKLQDMNGGRGPSAWRAMDWNEVNQYGRNDGSAPFTFDLAGRILPSSPSQGTKRGVCPEFQVALCNAIGSDLHFNVPHQSSGISDEDYVAYLHDVFTRIRDGSPAVAGINGGQPFAGLAPDLKVTVEFSNETWNSGFPVHTWLKQKGLANGRTVAQQVAVEIRRVFGVANEVFSGPEAARLRRFVGGWIVDPSYVQAILDALGQDVQVDAIGPACYFGPRNVDINGWMQGATSSENCPNCPLPEEVIESARKRIAELDPKLLAHRQIASAHVNPDGSHPLLELYEAGASFEAGYQPWGQAASQAQRLPAMYDVYVLDFVPVLISRGIDVVNWYSFMTDRSQGAAGPFGHWERMDQTITLPVPDVYIDEGLPKAAAIYKLPPRRTP